MKNHHKKVSENRKLLLCTVLGKASTHTDNLVVLYVISNNIHLHTNYIITYKSDIQLHFQRVDGKFENICIDMFFKF